MGEQTERTTLILFSGDLDRSMAAFIIANGAAAYGHEVTIFFTFWGLNLLRRDGKVNVKKGLLERAFGWMMPKGPERLGLSRLNMLGMGPKMINHVIRKHKALSVKELLELTQEQGVRLVACTMTMDLLGFTKEELIDGIEYAGVATYLADASEGRVNLFI